jgi:quinol monooxygenase YgiN
VEGILEMSDTYTVIVILESKPGKEAELKAALMEGVELSRREEGCIEYRLCQDSENPSQFGLYEKWKSKALHQVHCSKPYITEFAKQAKTLLLAGPYQGAFGKEII